MTTEQPITATIEVRLERKESETRKDVEERLVLETLAHLLPGEHTHWDGDTLVYRDEWPLMKMVEWHMNWSIGRHFQHDFVICPCCERPNEYVAAYSPCRTCIKSPEYQMDTDDTRKNTCPTAKYNDIYFKRKPCDDEVPGYRHGRKIL